MRNPIRSVSGRMIDATALIKPQINRVASH